MSESLTIGIDFDNTLVCYNKSIVKLAEKIFGLTLSSSSKGEIKSFVKNEYGDSAWTKFQGELIELEEMFPEKECKEIYCH